VAEYNYEIISTGGTREALKKAGIKSIKVSSLTDYPEILDGRVKTLHPVIFASVLADVTNKEHLDTLKKYEIKPVDLVIVNLYPFKEVAATNPPLEDLIENIDIGGPSLLRASSKNYKNVAVVSSPSQYDELLSVMSKNKGETTLAFREKLAVKVFEHTFSYDKAICENLSTRFSVSNTSEVLELKYKKSKELRYGENSHQKAAYYVDFTNPDDELPFTVLQGKELSYNNIVDVTAALKVVNEFGNVPSCCVIKHGNPCGVALGKTGFEAYKKAINADVISAFGGIVAVNTEVTLEMAQLMVEIFLEVIVATKFSDEAKSILAAKKNLRLIEYSMGMRLVPDNLIKDVAGGILVQSSDTKMITKEDLKVVTEKKPSEAEMDDMLFAWKVAKHVNSNAIIIAKNGVTLGIGCGQTSRIASMEIALRQACDEAKDAVIASDGFFPAIDNIQAAAQSRISAIVQPGGSIKDKYVISESQKLGIAMVFTGVRHFRH
jgi:phosphoribosylaminoimidazolecarboxamide formyltransferase/IMP cyclohydrolase